MALGELPDYPWDLMAPYVARAGRAEPFGDTSGVVDLSIGSPVDPTPEVIRRALADATDAHAYPQTVGTPALREAIVAWFERRRGVPGLATENVLPTIGSKELVAFLPFFLGLGEGDAVVHPRAAYPTYAIGAALAGAQSVAADDPADWPTNTRLVWLNSPGNPDGRVLSAVELAAAVSRARELGAVVASDECYAELGWEGPWHDEPIPSVLDPRVIGDDRTDVLAVYSLSKQSNLAGYRAAFIAGDPRLIARLTTVRKHAGLMLPSPLQAAMVASSFPPWRPPASASTAARRASTCGRPKGATPGRASAGSPTSESSPARAFSTGSTSRSTCGSRSRRRTSGSRPRPPGCARLERLSNHRPAPLRDATVAARVG